MKGVSERKSIIFHACLQAVIFNCKFSLSPFSRFLSDNKEHDWKINYRLLWALSIFVQLGSHVECEGEEKLLN